VNQFISHWDAGDVVNNHEQVKTARMCLDELHARVMESLSKAYYLASVEAHILCSFLNTAEHLVKWPCTPNPFSTAENDFMSAHVPPSTSAVRISETQTPPIGRLPRQEIVGYVEPEGQRKRRKVEREPITLSDDDDTDASVHDLAL
jgi:hypothetical protein